MAEKHKDVFCRGCSLFRIPFIGSSTIRYLCQCCINNMHSFSIMLQTFKHSLLINITIILLIIKVSMMCDDAHTNNIKMLSILIQPKLGQLDLCIATASTSISNLTPHAVYMYLAGLGPITKA